MSIISKGKTPTMTIALYMIPLKTALHTLTPISELCIIYFRDPLFQSQPPPNPTLTFPISGGDRTQIFFSLTPFTTCSIFLFRFLAQINLLQSHYVSFCFYLVLWTPFAAIFDIPIFFPCSADTL